MPLDKKIYTGYDVAIIEVTYRCQCQCPGCYMVTDNLLGAEEMSFSQAINIIDLSKDYNKRELKEVQLGGGEPLLWPHLKEYIEELVKRKIKVHLYTNLIAITPELAKWFLGREVQITGKLNINPEGGEEQLKVQASMIGRDIALAKKLINGIEILIKAGYKSPFFRLNNLLRKDNLKFALDYYRWCLQHNIEPDFELMSSGGKGKIDDNYFEVAPQPQEIAETIKELQSVRKELDLKEAEILMPHIFSSCPYCKNQLYFSLNGDIKVCSTSGLSKLANINEAQAIKKALESEVVKTRNNLKQELMGEPCKFCQSWQNCQGGCRATAESNGDLFAGYEICPVPFQKVINS